MRVASRGQEELWLGTKFGLAAIGVSAPPPVRDTPFNHFFDIELGSSGELWVASMPSDKEGRPEGMYRFDGEGWDVHGRSQGLPSNIAVAVARDLEDFGRYFLLINAVLERFRISAPQAPKNQILPPKSSIL